LPPSPSGFIHIHADIILRDVDLYLVYLSQYGDRGGGGMDAPLGFGYRNPLHPVGARLELQPGVGPFAFDVESDLF
jgi:hypothetical protein